MTLSENYEAARTMWVKFYGTDFVARDFWATVLNTFEELGA
jgi:hypothetical protein